MPPDRLLTYERINKPTSTQLLFVFVSMLLTAAVVLGVPWQHLFEPDFGERLAYTTTSIVSAETKSRINRAFVDFKRYLRRVGYQPTTEEITIDIREEMTVNMNMLSYYDPAKRLIAIDGRYAGEPVFLYHEFMRYVLNPGRTRDHEIWAYLAIESGLAVYFPSSFVDNPRPIPTIPDLAGRRSFAELRPSLESAQTDGAEVWGSAFWEMRQKLGQNKADKLLFKCWGEFQAADVASDQGVAFVRKLLDLDITNQAQIRAIFTRRGMTF